MNKQLGKIYATLLVMTTLGVVMAFSARPGAGELKISMVHYVNSTLMQLDTVMYTNALGQQFNVTKFKYYIGKIALHSTEGKDVALPGYYLVNEEDPDTKQLQCKGVPVGQYSSVSFIVGVDSADNGTGLQSGALDPVNAMFWTWNTGYVFLKLEGTSAVSKSPGHIVEYHIGGFKAPVNSIRRMTINFPKPLVINANGQSTIQLKADAAEVLQTPNAIDFSKLSSVTDFTNATMIADNYNDMFSLMGME